MNSNFSFLRRYWSSLADLGEDAEDQLYYDNSACVMKMGAFTETLVEEIYYAERFSAYEEESLYEKIQRLEEKGILPYKIKDILHYIRMERNDVVHENVNVSSADAEDMLRMCHYLGAWFVRNYSRGEIKVPPYRRPERQQRRPVQVKEKNRDSGENQDREMITLLTLLLFCSVALNIYLLLK